MRHDIIWDQYTNSPVFGLQPENKLEQYTIKCMQYVSTAFLDRFRPLPHRSHCIVAWDVLKVTMESCQPNISIPPISCPSSRAHHTSMLHTRGLHLHGMAPVGDHTAF